ncbi:phospholipase A1-IIgamma-like [Mangifera indica]|uniref:phospholipase A1-IIgamma-like n=1 Tax=Mangifera indica TaxID=29780 RepID=UPI001CFA0828|nr:phospholipase A1-IIgamma-like [Mangifera indica]
MANWKKLSGEKNWEGLLKPLNSNLGNHIKLYGERVQVIYDSVNSEDKTRPAYAMEDLFSEAAIETGTFGKLYTVTDYIFANSDVASWIDWMVKDQSAWFGYVAVATDEGKKVLGRRDILICWRGTRSPAEWFKNAQFDQVSASEIFGNSHDPQVHKGFLSIYTSPSTEPSSSNLSARDQVMNAVKNLVNKPEYREEEISITVAGHSLGAALATLNATDIVTNQYNKRTGSKEACVVTAFVFASPKVGNEGFRKVFNALSNLHLLRIENRLDIVTDLPPSSISYKKVGMKLRIKSHKSALLNFTDGFQLHDIIPQSHSLKEYLQGVTARQSQLGKLQSKL